MKKIFFHLIFLLFLIAYISGLNPENLTQYGWVNDYTGILSYSEKEKINSIILELERKTTAEIAVVILKDLEGENIEDFTNRLFQKWGIGKKEKNNGVMILIALAQKAIRIETGYGIEGIIPDAKAGRIIREIMVPLFKEGKFGEGILNAVYVIATDIADEAKVKLNLEKRNIKNGQYQKLTKKDLILFLFFMFFLMPIFIRHPWLFFLFFTSERGGRFPGGGFGGGFGGFGGGLSGGGGATGRW